MILRLPDRSTVLVLSIFLYTFCSSGYFLVKAIQSNRGTVTTNAYGDSLIYQETVDQLSQSKKLGWKLQKSTTNMIPTITVIDRNAIPVTGAEMTLRGLYGAEKNRDVTLVMQEDANRPGTYHSSQPFSAKGVWLVELHISRESEKFLWKGQIAVS